MRLPNLKGDVARLSLSNVFNNAVTFITGFIIAATVTAESFGIYSVSLNVVMTVFSLGELGLGISVVKFYNQENDEDIRKNVLIAGMAVKLAVSIMLVLLSFPLGFLLSNILSPEHSINNELMYAVICAGALGIWSFVRIMNQARQDYGHYAGLTLYYGLVRLIVVAILIGTNVSEAVYYLVALYLAAPLLVAGPAVFRFIRETGVRLENTIPTQAKILLSYGKWVMAGGILYPLCFSLPLFLIMRIEGADSAGQYAIGLMFVALISPFNDAMRAYVLPKVTGFKGYDDAHNYISSIKRYAIPCAIGILLIMLMSAVTYKLFLSEKYPDSLLNIELLILASGLTVFGGMLNVVAHFLGLPHIDAWVNVGRVIFIFFACLISVPVFGSLGAVLSTGMALILGELTSFIVIRRKLNEAYR